MCIIACYSVLHDNTVVRLAMHVMQPRSVRAHAMHQLTCEGMMYGSCMLSAAGTPSGASPVPADCVVAAQFTCKAGVHTIKLVARNIDCYVHTSLLQGVQVAGHAMQDAGRHVSKISVALEMCQGLV